MPTFAKMHVLKTINVLCHSICFVSKMFRFPSCNLHFQHHDCGTAIFVCFKLFHANVLLFFKQYKDNILDKSFLNLKHFMQILICCTKKSGEVVNLTLHIREQDKMFCFEARLSESRRKYILSHTKPIAQKLYHRSLSTDSASAVQ